MFALACYGIIAAVTVGGVGVIWWGVSSEDKKKENDEKFSSRPYERPLSLEREDITTYP